MFLQVLQNIQFLRRQGLAFRSDNGNGNFDQLLKKSEQIHPRISTWIKKNRNKFLHNEHQIIKIMALKILQDIAKDISNSIFYTIMADEVTDASNHEQFLTCLRWVDQFLEVYEDFIGLYKVGNIKADTLRTAIEYVLLQLAISLQNARGQCYDGASNIMGLRSGLATQILDKSPKAFLIHCFAHALNLSVNDMVRQIPFLENLSNSLEISNLIKLSPKRNALLDKLHKELAAGYPGFRTLCPTRWTVRENYLKSILDNWLPLQKLWQESLSGAGLQPELRGRIISVQAQMETFEYYFGVTIIQKILGHSDNLSRSIQSPDLTAKDAKY